MCMRDRDGCFLQKLNALTGALVVAVGYVPRHKKRVRSSQHREKILVGLIVQIADHRKRDGPGKLAGMMDVRSQYPHLQKGTFLPFMGESWVIVAQNRKDVNIRGQARPNPETSVPAHLTRGFCTGIITIRVFDHTRLLTGGERLCASAGFF